MLDVKSEVEKSKKQSRGRPHDVKADRKRPPRPLSHDNMMRKHSKHFDAAALLLLLSLSLGRRSLSSLRTRRNRLLRFRFLLNLLLFGNSRCRRLLTLLFCQLLLPLGLCASLLLTKSSQSEGQLIVSFSPFSSGGLKRT